MVNLAKKYQNDYRKQAEKLDPRDPERKIGYRAARVSFLRQQRDPEGKWRRNRAEARTEHR